MTLSSEWVVEARDFVNIVYHDTRNATTPIICGFNGHHFLRHNIVFFTAPPHVCMTEKTRESDLATFDSMESGKP